MLDATLSHTGAQSQIQLLSKNSLNRPRNEGIYSEGAGDGSQIQILPWKAKAAEPKGWESCTMDPQEHLCHILWD